MKTQYFKKTFTDIYLQRLKSSCDLQITDGDVSGLHLRYYAGTKRKVFYLSYLAKGTHQQRNIKIGIYGEMTLKEIRMKAIKYKQEVYEGIDPMFEIQKRAKEYAIDEAKQIKVSSLMPIYLEKYCKNHNKESTYISNKSMANINILPIMGNAIISEIDLGYLQDCYDKLASEKSVACANHAKSFISTFLNWCEKYKHRPLNSNPCKHIQHRQSKKIDYNIIDLNGYKALLKAINDGIQYEPYTPTAFRALKLLMLTGARSSEITELQVHEVALDEKFIHLDKRKGDRAKDAIMDIALNTPARELVEEALRENNGSKYVFPSPVDNKKPIIDLRKPLAWALKKANLPHMRVHDLRHSFGTLLDELGFDNDTIGDTLGHADSSITKLYSKHRVNAKRLKTTEIAAEAIMAA